MVGPGEQECSGVIDYINLDIYRPLITVVLRTSSMCLELLAELQRAKRTSGAQRVRKFGKPSSPENLVIT